MVFPSLVYYDSHFDLVPESQSCSNAATSLECKASLLFPTAAIPFNLKTTSSIEESITMCYDNNLKPVPLNTGIKIQLRGTGPVNGVYLYDFTWGTNPGSASLTSQIKCSSTYHKSLQSPYFYVMSATNNQPLFKSSKIIQSDLTISPHPGDCHEKTSNSCTLVYRLPNTSPSLFPDQVWAPGFQMTLQPKPVTCPTTVTQDLPMFNNYLCQTFTKSLQTVIPSGRTKAVKSNDVILTYVFPDYNIAAPKQTETLTLTFDASLITYTTPLLFLWDDTTCNDIASPFCPLTIRSLHTGPKVSMTIDFPYTGRIDQTAECSNYAHIDPVSSKLSIPGNLVQSAHVPHPHDLNGEGTFHWCKVRVLKQPMAVYLQKTTHSIANYDIFQSFHSSSLLPESSLKSIIITQPFKRFPVDITLGSDCTHRDLEWCSVIFTPTQDFRLDSFSFSPVGMTAPARDVDWELSYTLSAQSFFRVEMSRISTRYRHPGSTPMGSLFGLTSNCNAQADTLPRCRPPPAQIQAPLCVPRCNQLQPNDPLNPCDPCSDGVELFTVTITGSVDQPFTFKYRKQVWRVHYRNAIYLYSYNNHPFMDGIRIGNGDLDPVMFDPVPQPTVSPVVVIEYQPDFAVTFTNCHLPHVLICIGTVSRRESTTAAIYFTLDQSTFFGSLATVLDVPVFDVQSKSIITIQTTFLPTESPYSTLFDFPTQLPKRFGINQISHTYKYNVLPCPPEVDLSAVGTVPIAGCSFGRTQFSHMVVFEDDALPVFDADCTETSSETCTITYPIRSTIGTFKSDPRTPGPKGCYTNPDDPTCWTEFIVVKHYVPHRSAVFGFTFAPTFATKEEYGGSVATQLFPGLNLRNFNTRYPLTYEPTCDGESMDVMTKFELRWSDGCLTQAQNGGKVDTACTQIKDLQGNPIGILQIVMTRGELPLGGRCRVVLTKRASIHPTKRFRTLPLVLYNQPMDSFQHIKPSHYITFPIIGWMRMRMTGTKDCTTQTRTVVTCSIDVNFFASEKNPLQFLWIRVPDALRHPLILVSPEPYYIYKTINGVQTRIGEITVFEAVVEPMEVNGGGERIDHHSHILQLDGTPFQHSQDESLFDPLQTVAYPPRDLTVRIYPKWQTQDVSAVLTLKTRTIVTMPVPFTAFNVQFFLNGFSLTNSKTMPLIEFPHSITGQLFLLRSNVTKTTPSSPWSSLEFLWFYNNILKITINQDFGAYDPAMSALVNLVGSNGGAIGGSNFDSAWFNPTTRPAIPFTSTQFDLPCYNSRPEDSKQSNRIPYWLYQRHYESSQGSSILEGNGGISDFENTLEDEISNNREIVAWIRTNPFTKQSILVPITPSAMVGKRCYIYYQPKRNSGVIEVHHDILVFGNNPTKSFNVDYYGLYPPHVVISHIVPLV